MFQPMYVTLENAGSVLSVPERAVSTVTPPAGPASSGLSVALGQQACPASSEVDTLN